MQNQKKCVAVAELATYIYVGYPCAAAIWKWLILETNNNSASVKCQVCAAKPNQSLPS